MDWDKEKDKLSVNSICSDNKTWFIPSKDDENYGANNFGVGMDVEDGTVPEAEFYK